MIFFVGVVLFFILVPLDECGWIPACAGMTGGEKLPQLQVQQ